ncbi:MAG: NTP transferase domain-containing protein [Candidatus Omnitrophica bacterium]|nr:NTP transferase domain-containing protein [Candidatus Omnitrophota bacterium]
MKGIVLAGGLGSRLNPLTKVTNKHLLPVYNKPMIFYPIETLVKGGIKDVLLVTGGTSSGDFLRLLGNGKSLGLRSLHYAYQEGEGGIAHALGLAEHFVDGARSIVILGDNILEEDIGPYIEKFKLQESGARILLKKVADPSRFGVAEIQNGKVARIVEKPARPKTFYAVTGVYMYDGNVFEIVKKLKPSHRGELEITDVNNAYVKKGQMEYDILKGFWTDAGTFDSLLRANQLASRASEKKS